MDDNINIFDPAYKPKGYYTCHRREMLDFIPHNATKILDVGCSSGFFGKLIKSQRNAEVWGIEICENAAKEAMTKLDRVLVGDIESNNISLPQNYFDCVVFNDVLEHLKYPWIVLRRVRSNLKMSGYIVASIPNVRYYVNVKQLLIRKEWEYVDQGILDKTHLRFFTIKSIKNMFQGCGYRILNIEGINSQGFPWKFKVLNTILLGTLDDMKFIQFACVAQKTDR